jgi:uncharacterized membrane protein
MDAHERAGTRFAGSRAESESAKVFASVQVDARPKMKQEIQKPRSRAAAIAFALLDPIPYGFFVAALVFDVTYARSAEVLWIKSAAWLIAAGLVFAVLPRLIDLVWVWFPGRRRRAQGAMAGFWLNLLAIASALVNAFVHSRDAYGAMPEGLWLSILTVVLLVLAKVMTARQCVEEGT